MPSHISGILLYVIDTFDSVPPCLSDIYGDPVYQASLISGMHCIHYYMQIAYHWLRVYDPPDQSKLIQIISLLLQLKILFATSITII